MFRNQYDSDVTTWSPQGRLHQVEYAMEAVKQGSATVGLKSNTHAVLVALKRASSELSAHQKKIIPLDTHMGISIAGLTADGKSLSRWMRTECLHSRYFNDTALRVSTLMWDLGNKMQLCIQGYNKRPYGVGLWWLDMMISDHTFIRFVRLRISMIVKPCPLVQDHNLQEPI